MESDCTDRRRRRLPESDVSDGSVSVENTEPCVSAAAKSGNRFDDIAAAGDFEYIRTHRRLGLAAGDNDGRWLRLVLGSRRAAAGAAYNLDGSSVAGGGRFFENHGVSERRGTGRGILIGGGW